MVPDSFDGFFTAAASAAGALISLLFVAVVFGEAIVKRRHYICV